MSSQITCVDVTRGSANEMQLRLIGKLVPEAGIVVAHITLCLRFAVSFLFKHSEVRFCGFVAAVWSSACIVVAPELARECACPQPSLVKSQLQETVG